MQCCFADNRCLFWKQQYWCLIRAHIVKIVSRLHRRYCDFFRNRKKDLEDMGTAPQG